MSRPADQPLADRKARDRAAILPLIGAILFLPPVAGAVRMDAMVAGIPLLVVYIFAVWAVLIAGAALLARRLGEGAPDETAGAGATGAAGGGDGPGDPG